MRKKFMALTLSLALFSSNAPYLVHAVSELSNQNDDDNQVDEVVAVSETAGEEDTSTDEDASTDEDVLAEDEDISTDEEALAEDEDTSTDEDVLAEDEDTSTDEDALAEDEDTSTDEDVLAEDEDALAEEEDALVIDETPTLFTTITGLEDSLTATWELGSSSSVAGKLEQSVGGRDSVLSIESGTSNSNNTVTLAEPINLTESQSIIVKFDMYADDISNLKGGLKLYDDTTEMARLKMEKGSNKHANNSEFSYTTISDVVTSEKWYSVELEYTLFWDNMMTTIKVDDKLISENNGNPGVIDELTKITFFTDSGCDGTLSFDNIEVVTGMVEAPPDLETYHIEEETAPSVGTWTLDSTGCSSLIEDPTSSDRSKVLAMAGNGSTSGISNNFALSANNIINETQGLVVSFDYYSDQTNGDVKGGIKLYDNDTVESARFKIENANLKPATTTTSTYATISNKITDGKWQTVKLVYTLDGTGAMKTNIYVDGELVGEDVSNPTNPTEIKRINFFLDTSSAGTAYYDKILVYPLIVEEPIPVQEEETLEYTLSWSGGTSFIEETDEDGDAYNNTVLKVEAGTSSVSNHTSIADAISGMEDEFTLSYKIMSERDAEAGQLQGGYKLYTGGSVTGTKETARFLITDETLKYTNGNSTATENATLSASYTTLSSNLTANTWHDVVHIFKKNSNNDGYTLDAYLNGFELTKDLALPVRSEFDYNFTNLSFYANSGQVGTFWYDDINVTKGSQVPEEPYVPPVDPTVATDKPYIDLDNIPSLPSLAAYPSSNVYGAGLNGYTLITPSASTKKVDVSTVGILPSTSTRNDVTSAVRSAITSADYGTELYFPAGTYYFETSDSTILTLKSGVSITGDPNGGTIFKLYNETEGKTITFMNGSGVKNFAIRDITFTSHFFGEYPDPVAVGALGTNNTRFGEYANGIRLDYNSSTGSSCSQIELTGLTFENFSTMAVRLANTQDVRVKGCDFLYATDIGGGGAGYGISVQGTNGVDTFGYESDSMYNVVEECRFIGPYIRHGILLQYYTHNNLLINNMLIDTGYGSIDLHGEDEYLNEIYNNIIYNCRWGGAIELGNSGAGHDNAGPMNYVHGNDIVGGYRGIDVVFNTDDTVIENNTLSALKISGIWVDSGARTSIRNNTITNSTKAIYLEDNAGYTYNSVFYGGGTADYTDVYGNTFDNCSPNYQVDAGVYNTIQDSSYTPDGTMVVAQSHDAYIAGIKLEDGVNFTTLFLPERNTTDMNYVFNAYTDKSTLTFDLETSAKNVTSITINGETGKNGSNTVSLPVVGDNKVEIVVVSEDGESTKTYTINAIRINEGEDIPTPVTSVALTDSAPTIPLGREYTIGVAVMPVAASNRTITWEITDGSDVISIDENGTVTTLKEGVASVKVSSVSNPEVYCEFDVTIIGKLDYQPITDPNAVKLTAVEATATTSDGSKPPENAIDGLVSTSWAGLASVSNNVLVESADLIIELDDVCLIQHVDLTWDSATTRKGYFELWVSEDGVNYTKAFDGNSSGVTALSESYLINDANDNESYTGDNEGLVGKYVKFVGNGNISNSGTTLAGWNSLKEVEIYGQELEPTVTPFDVPTGVIDVSVSGNDITVNYYDDVDAPAGATMQYAVSTSDDGSNLTWYPNSTIAVGAGGNYYVYVRWTPEIDNTTNTASDYLVSASYYNVGATDLSGSTVTFDLNGGDSTTPATATTATDGRITLPSDPTKDELVVKEGSKTTTTTTYTFLGWYTLPGGGTKVTASYVFTGDTKVYAQWDESVTVTVEVVVDKEVTLGTATTGTVDVTITVPETTVGTDESLNVTVDLSGITVESGANLTDVTVTLEITGVTTNVAKVEVDADILTELTEAGATVEITVQTNEDTSTIDTPTLDTSEIENVGAEVKWVIDDSVTLVETIDLAVSLFDAYSENTEKNIAEVIQSALTNKYNNVDTVAGLINFSHTGSLVSSGDGVKVEIDVSNLTDFDDTTSKNVYLYKIENGVIVVSNPISATIENGTLSVEMTSCSDYLISESLISLASSSSDDSYYYTGTTTPSVQQDVVVQSNTVSDGITSVGSYVTPSKQVSESDFAEYSTIDPIFTVRPSGTSQGTITFTLSNLDTSKRLAVFTSTDGANWAETSFTYTAGAAVTMNNGIISPALSINSSVKTISFTANPNSYYTVAYVPSVSYSGSSSSSSSSYSSAVYYDSGSVRVNGTYISELRNILVGELVNLNKITTFNGQTILGWYYDEAMTQEVSNTSNFVITSSVISNGLFVKTNGDTVIPDTFVDGSVNAGAGGVVSGGSSDYTPSTVPSTIAKFLSKLF